MAIRYLLDGVVGRVRFMGNVVSHASRQYSYTQYSDKAFYNKLEPKSHFLIFNDVRKETKQNLCFVTIQIYEYLAYIPYSTPYPFTVITFRNRHIYGG